MNRDPRSYLSRIPVELLREALLKIPYPEITEKCDIFCDSNSFWRTKAALEIGIENDQEFTEFFDQPELNPILRYLRALAYYNIARRDSEAFLSPLQIMDYAIKNDDQKLLYHAIDLYVSWAKEKHITNQFLPPYILQDDIEALAYYLQKSNKQIYTPRFVKILTNPENKAKLPLFRKAIEGNNLSTDTYDFLQERINEIEVSDIITPSSLLNPLKFLIALELKSDLVDSIRQRLIDEGTYDTVTQEELAFYIDTQNREAILHFLQTEVVDPTDDILLMSIAKVDDPELVKLIIQEQQLDNDKFYWELLGYAQWESRLFEYCLSKVNPNDLVKHELTIARKSHLDFAGLVVLVDMVQPQLITDFHFHSFSHYKPATLEILGKE